MTTASAATPSPAAGPSFEVSGGFGAASPPAPGTGTPGRRPRATGWLAVLPLLVFVVVVFGLRAYAIAVGASHPPASDPDGSHFTTANMSQSVHGSYVTALLGSVKLSALTALLAVVLGLPLA